MSSILRGQNVPCYTGWITPACICLTCTETSGALLRRQAGRGLTPNPDLACNRHIKFGALAAWAAERGADALATGHYARLRRPADGGPAQLLRGVDASKDQSYFLAAVPGAALARAEFPVGGLLKGAVRALAAEAGLASAARRSSAGICFIGAPLGRGRCADEAALVQRLCLRHNMQCPIAHRMHRPALLPGCVSQPPHPPLGRPPQVWGVPGGLRRAAGGALRGRRHRRRPGPLRQPGRPDAWAAC